MAESVFRQTVKDSGLLDRFSIESAGTAGYHTGEKPDYRCIQTLEKHGIDYYSRARTVRKSDLSAFDMVLAMDHSNLLDLESLQEGDNQRIELFRTYDPTPGDYVVPDPYYGTISDFENVYDMVSRTSIALLEHLKKTNKWE